LRESAPRSSTSPVCTKTARPPAQRSRASISFAAFRIATKPSNAPWTSPTATTRSCVRMPQTDAAAP
jgi:hypothetical protein